MVKMTIDDSEKHSTCQYTKQDTNHNTHGFNLVKAKQRSDDKQGKIQGFRNENDFAQRLNRSEQWSNKIRITMEGVQRRQLAIFKN